MIYPHPQILFIIDPNFNGFTYSPHFAQNLPDLNKREFTIISILVVIIVVSGIYPAFILDGLHYSVSTLIYSLYYSNTF